MKYRPFFRVLGLAALTLLLNATVRAQPAAEVTAISDADGSIGETVTLTVEADLTSIATYNNLRFEFDPAVIAVRGVVEGSDIDFLFGPNTNIDNDLGFVRVSGFNQPSDPLTAVGQFLLIEIDVVGDGGSLFELVSGFFETEGGDQIAVDSLSGAVNRAILPVELTSFEAVRDGRDVVLRWTTASETNNSGFEVEHRAGPDGPWQRRAWVEGHGTTLEAQAYRHRLEGLAPGRHTFRLHQIDYDGTSAYSPEVEVQIAVEDAFLLEPPRPNPFRGATSLALSVAETQHVEVDVYDVTGRRVARLFDGSLAADAARTLTWRAADLPGGLYLVRVAGETFATTQKVTVLK